jgi:hypothetical protein
VDRARKWPIRPSRRPLHRPGVRSAGRRTDMEEYLLVLDDDILNAVHLMVEMIAGLFR